MKQLQRKTSTQLAEFRAALSLLLQFGYGYPPSPVSGVSCYYISALHLDLTTVHETPPATQPSWGCLLSKPVLLSQQEAEPSCSCSGGCQHWLCSKMPVMWIWVQVREHQLL